MEKIIYTIKDENGIHARPAGHIVSTAKKFAAQIRVIFPEGGRSADAKKLFEVMGLGVKQGDTIKIEAEGQDAEKALHALDIVLSDAGI